MEKKAQPLVCALIINYNGRKLLDAFLPTFKKTDYANYKVIVVENGSTDSSMSDFESAYPWVDLLRLEKNQGVAGGTNAGMRYAVEKYDPDYVLHLDNDMEVLEPGWLSELVRVAETEPRVGIVGLKLITPGSIINYAGGRLSPFSASYHPFMGQKDDHSHDKIEDTDFICGACQLIKRVVLENIGLFDERYNPIYFEDAEFCARAKRFGYRIIYDGKVSMQHYKPGTPAGILSLNDKFYEIWIRNRVRFILFNLHFYWWPILFARLFFSVFFARNEKNRLFFAITFPRRLVFLARGLLSALASPSSLNTQLRAPGKSP